MDDYPFEAQNNLINKLIKAAKNHQLVFNKKSPIRDLIYPPQGSLIVNLKHEQTLPKSPLT